jgi:MFS family permease
VASLRHSIRTVVRVRLAPGHSGVLLGRTRAHGGIVLTLTFAGDVVVSLVLTTQADRIGRRRMLIVGAILMAAAGVAFASTRKSVF